MSGNINNSNIPPTTESEETKVPVNTELINDLEETKVPINDSDETKEKKEKKEESKKDGERNIPPVFLSLKDDDDWMDSIDETTSIEELIRKSDRMIGISISLNKPYAKDIQLEVQKEQLVKRGILVRVQTL